MVRIDPPPPNRPVRPIHRTVPDGASLVRILDPTRRGATALTFRSNGPRKRFDHHHGEKGSPFHTPCDDPDRAVYYCAWSDTFTEPGDAVREALSSCLVEVFGDTGIVEYGDRVVAMPTVVRSLHLLDLRGNGAMRAGPVAAIAKCEYHYSQPWSRYFYENPGTFETIDGLYYSNAHNDKPAVLLYERAAEALICSESDAIRLDNPDPNFQHLIHEIMLQNNLVFG